MEYLVAKLTLIALLVVLLIISPASAADDIQWNLEVPPDTKHILRGQHFYISLIPSEDVPDETRYTVKFQYQGNIEYSKLFSANGLAHCYIAERKAVLVEMRPDSMGLYVLEKINANARIKCPLWLKPDAGPSYMYIESPSGERKTIFIDTSTATKPIITQVIQDAKSANFLVTVELRDLPPDIIYPLTFRYQLPGGSLGDSLSLTDKVVDLISADSTFDSMITPNVRLWFREGYATSAKLNIVTGEFPENVVRFTVPIPAVQSLPTERPLFATGPLSVLAELRGSSVSTPFIMSKIDSYEPKLVLTHPSATTASIRYDFYARTPIDKPTLKMTWIGYDAEVIFAPSTKCELKMYKNGSDFGANIDFSKQAMEYQLTDLKAGDWFIIRGKFSVEAPFEYHLTAATFSVEKLTASAPLYPPTAFTISDVSATDALLKFTINVAKDKAVAVPFVGKLDFVYSKMPFYLASRDIRKFGSPLACKSNSSIDIFVPKLTPQGLDPGQVLLTFSGSLEDETKTASFECTQELNPGPKPESFAHIMIGGVQTSPPVEWKTVNTAKYNQKVAVRGPPITNAGEFKVYIAKVLDTLHQYSSFSTLTVDTIYYISSYYTLHSASRLHGVFGQFNNFLPFISTPGSRYDFVFNRDPGSTEVNREKIILEDYEFDILSDGGAASNYGVVDAPASYLDGTNEEWVQNNLALPRSHGSPCITTDSCKTFITERSYFCVKGMCLHPSELFVPTPPAPDPQPDTAPHLTAFVAIILVIAAVFVL